MDQPAPRPRAFSYLRFSTPQQMQGDSFRRQTTMAQDYAQRHGLELDENLTFHDLGVSAFKGLNAEVGRLAEFREAVQVGLVPRGSYLLVEALDRLSRLTPRKAIRVLEDIVELGITVVTLNDGKAYTAESLDADQVSLLIAIITFMRANEESVTKARRLRAAWEGKRITAAEKPLTATVPAWLRMDKEQGRIVPIPERVAVVQRIFSEYLSGRGHHLIAAGLNEDGVPCFGSAAYWHRSYVSKILKSPGAYGTYVPHRYAYEGSKRLRVPLDPLPNYYPAAVSEEVFHEAQALSTGRMAPKLRSGKRVSLLAGLAQCPLCASTMTRVNKGYGGKAGRPKLVCVRAKDGAGCKYHGVDIETVESALLDHAPQLCDAAPAGDANIESELAALETGIDVTRDGMRNLIDAITASPSPALSERLHELETSLSEAEQRRGELLERYEAALGPVLQNRVQLAQLALLEEPFDPMKANAGLRSVLRSVVVDYLQGLLVLYWKQGGTSETRFAMPRS